MVTQVHLYINFYTKKMKKINYITLSLLALLTLMSACEGSGKDEYLDDYACLLYFRNSGLQETNIYTTGEDAAYPVVINKAGSDKYAQADATVAIMDQLQIAIYNEKNGTDYEPLPSSCYTLDNTSFHFDAKNENQIINVSLKTNDIALLPEADYILPLVMTSNSKVNEDKNMFILKPKIFTPSVAFETTGYQGNTISDEETGDIEITIPVTLPLDNQWTFDCTVTVNEQLLTEYNTENNTHYALLPSEYYTLNPTASFIPGENKANLSFTVKRDALAYGKFVLPLQLTNCSMSTFVINPEKNTCLYGFNYVPSKDKFTAMTLDDTIVTSNSPAAEGSIANLFDGALDTYFHSVYDGSLGTDVYYLQIVLPENNYMGFYFEFTDRNNNSNGNPNDLLIAVSLDGTNYTNIDEIKGEDDKLVSTAGGVYQSDAILSPSQFKYIRLYNAKNNVGSEYFVYAEFKLWTLKE